ncbi:MAG: hypothetical protein AB8G23_01105 [Myxococcota bacterium]
MPKRPFFVLPGGMCIPLEGPWRISLLRGEWYVLGHHTVVPCESKRAAFHKLAELEAQSEPDLLAAEAIAGLDRIPEHWETDSLGESDLAR